MANPQLLSHTSCTPYAAAQATTLLEPPELDHRFFTSEFLEELDEYHRVVAVSGFSA